MDAEVMNFGKFGYNLMDMYWLKIKYIDLNDVLNRIDGKVDPYFRDRSGKAGHWNTKGHQAIGIFLAEKIYAF